MKRVRLFSVVLILAVVFSAIAFTPGLADSQAPASPEASFTAGSLIIPMDIDAGGNHASFNQNVGMWKAYGLVYKLLQNDIPVHWAIKNPNKLYNDIDFSVTSVTDKRTGTALSAWDYRGGPFIIDSADAADALPIITAWWAANSNQPNVHEAQASFTAEVNIILRHAPVIANEAINGSISFAYYNAAGIPDLNGNTWSTSSPNVLDETEIANGGLFQIENTCLQRKFDTFVTPHNEGYVIDKNDPTNLGTKTYAQLDTFVHEGGGWTALCHSLSSNDTAIANLTLNGSAAVKAMFKTSLPGGKPGGFLTTSGFPFNPADPFDQTQGGPYNIAGTWTVAAAGLPVAQAVPNTVAQDLPGGSVQTWPRLGTFAPTYWGQTEKVAYFDNPTYTVTAKAHSGTTATLTIGAHTLVKKQNIVVALVPPDPAFDGTFAITAVSGTTVSYVNASATVGSTASGGTVNPVENDQVLNGVYHDGTGFGKLTYIGGHSFLTTAYATNMEAPYLRMFYNSLFFNGNAVAKLDVVYNPPQIPQFMTTTLDVSLKNTGASTANNIHDVSITLDPGFTYAGTSFGPAPVVTTVSGKVVLTWATLPDVLGGDTAVTVQLNVDSSVSATEGFKPFGTIHSQYGDVFGEAFTVDVCRAIEVRAIPDRGDLPDSYGTLNASNGPSHLFSAPGNPILGAYFDYETDGQPNATATGDDNNPVGGTDDEDGIGHPMLYPMYGSGPGSVPVTVSNGPACLNAWMDFTGDDASVLTAQDGNFTKVGGYDTYQAYSEHIIQNVPVNVGLNNVPFSVPPGLLNGAQYYFRFRLSLRDGNNGCTDTIAPTGPVVGGEVEDYQFSFTPLAVTLASLTAEAADTGVTVSWETVSNMDTRGFNLDRAESADGPWTQLNTVLIPVGTPLGSFDGGTYTYNDTTVAPGHTYWYRLDDVSLSGVVTPHPPVSAAAPTAVRLVSLGAGPALGSAMPLAAIGFALLTGFALARRQRQ